jgi:hypothetical protein
MKINLTSEDVNEYFGELIYELYEYHFNCIKDDFVDKHINNNEPFTNTQLDIIKEHLTEFIEDKIEL